MSIRRRRGGDDLSTTNDGEDDGWVHPGQEEDSARDPPLSSTGSGIDPLLVGFDTKNGGGDDDSNSDVDIILPSGRVLTAPGTPRAARAGSAKLPGGGVGGRVPNPHGDGPADERDFVPMTASAISDTWTEEDEFEDQRRNAYMDSILDKCLLTGILFMGSLFQMCYLDIMAGDEARVCIPNGPGDPHCLKGVEAHNVMVNAGNPQCV